MFCFSRGFGLPSYCVATVGQRMDAMAANKSSADSDAALPLESFAFTVAEYDIMFQFAAMSEARMLENNF